MGLRWAKDDSRGVLVSRVGQCELVVGKRSDGKTGWAALFDQGGGARRETDGPARSVAHAKRLAAGWVDRVWPLCGRR